jgi:hypothetical protein
MLWICLTSLVLFLIAYEDFRSRSVNVLLFIALAILLGYKSFKENLFYTWTTYVGFNFAYLALLLGMCSIYTFWKYKSWLLTNFLGAGDILFIAIVALLFSPVSFLLFNTVTFIVALASHILLSRISTRYLRFSTVPLAGFQSACLVLVIIYNGIV